MAQFKMNYVSQAVKDKLNLYITVPQSRQPFPDAMPTFSGSGISEDCPVLILLHDDGSSPYDLMTQTAVSRYAEENGIMLIAPEGHHSFFSDYAVRDRSSNTGNTGNAQIEAAFTELCYEQSVFEALDLVHSIFATTSDRKKVVIGGIGSGGFGALKIAMKYPHLFSHVFTIGGYTDLQWLMDHCPERREQFEAVFGGLQAQDENDLISSTSVTAGEMHPSILQCWCTDSYAAEMNLIYQAGISSTFPDYTAAVSNQRMGWGYVDCCLQQSILWINNQKGAEKIGK